MLVQAITSFATADHEFVNAGEVFDDTDPMVRSKPALFAPLTVRATGGPVESATAAPGEKRSATRSKKA